MAYPTLTMGTSSKNSSQYNINNFSYYSGSQITVWFGDILLDDVVSIQWSRTQNKKPIYGYASQQFDAVAKGNVLIQGSFITNFRQSGYISLIMQEIKRIYGNVTKKENWPVLQSVISKHLQNGTFGPQTSQEIIDIGNSPDFLSLVKGYESMIWGEPLTGAASPENGGSNYTANMSPDVRQQIEMPNGFSILITYGDTSGNGARTMNDYIQSTSKSLTGVHLIGESQVIQTGGQNVMEQYDFIARGTDEYVGSNS